MIPFPEEDDLLAQGLTVSDSLAPGWRDRLPPDDGLADLDDYDTHPEHLAGLAALEQAIVHATIIGDHAQASRLNMLANAEADRVEVAQRVAATPPRLTRADCPALTAWSRRADTTTADKLWQSACWEQQALALSAAGCYTGAQDALQRAKAIMADAGCVPTTEVPAGRRLGKATHPRRPSHLLLNRSLPLTPGLGRPVR